MLSSRLRTSIERSRRGSRENKDEREEMNVSQMFSSSTVIVDEEVDSYNVGTNVRREVLKDNRDFGGAFHGSGWSNALHPSDLLACHYVCRPVLS